MSKTILITVLTLNYIISSHRMIKETMRASGANSTRKHMEDVSLCALFLMDVAKRVDRMFGVSQSVAHTTRDAKKDINKMVVHLLGEKVTTEVMQRQSHIKFEDPSVAGSRIIAGGHIDTYLKGELDDIVSETDNDMDENIVDPNYELYDNVV